MGAAHDAGVDGPVDVPVEDMVGAEAGVGKV